MFILENLYEVSKGISKAIFSMIKEKPRKNSGIDNLKKEIQDQPAGVPVFLEEEELALTMTQDYRSTQYQESIRASRKRFRKRLQKREQLSGKYRQFVEAENIEYIMNHRNGYRERRWFFSERLQAVVIIEEHIITRKCRMKCRLAHASRQSLSSKITMYLQSMIASKAHSVDIEMKAISKLKQLVTEDQFRHYMLCGYFMEQSAKTGLHYMFRKMRPTVVLRFKKDKWHFVAALCMHVIGYYDFSWYGALCPTDDVITHLLFMRADEADFWKRAYAHPRDAVQADF